MQKRTNMKGNILTEYEGHLEFNPNYVDDDLIIIDNIKLLGVPDALYTNMNLIVLCLKGKAQMFVNG